MNKKKRKRKREKKIAHIRKSVREMANNFSFSCVELLNAKSHRDTFAYYGGKTISTAVVHTCERTPSETKHPVDVDIL